MMSLEEIKRINRTATRAAKRDRALPFVPTAAQRATLAKGDTGGLQIPFLADHVPAGWERINAAPLFVDISGFGAPGEPALTTKQLAVKVAALADGVGIALIEHGQFQGYCGLYRRKVAKLAGVAERRVA